MRNETPSQAREGKFLSRTLKNNGPTRASGAQEGEKIWS
jgi:hypothetical protein